MGAVYDLPNAKTVAKEAIESMPDDMTLRDMRRHLDKALRDADDHTRDVKVDTIAGFALTLIALAAIVYAVNT